MREPKIKEILSEGQTEKAIEETKKLVKDHPKFFNELVLLAGRLETLEDEKRKAVIDDASFRLEKNKINEGILYILDNHHLPFVEQVVTQQTSPKSNLKNYLLVGMTCLILGFLGFGFFNNDNAEATAQFETSENTGEPIAVGNAPQSTEVPKEPINFNLNDVTEIIELYFESKLIKRKDFFQIDANAKVLDLKGSLVNYYNLKHAVIKTQPHFDEIHWGLLKEMQYVDDEQKTLKESGFKNGDKITIQFAIQTHPTPAKPDEIILPKK